MKTRNGFVSNSSSSSFLILGGQDLSVRENFFKFNIDEIVKQCDPQYDKYTKQDIEAELEKMYEVIKTSQITLNKKIIKKLFYYNEEELHKFCQQQWLTTLGETYVNYEFYKMQQNYYRLEMQKDNIYQLEIQHAKSLKEDKLTDKQIRTLMDEYRKNNWTKIDAIYKRQSYYRKKFISNILNQEDILYNLIDCKYVYNFEISDGGGNGQLESYILEHLDWLNTHEFHTEYFYPNGLCFSVIKFSHH